MYICDNCKSDKIQSKEWVEVNTGKTMGLADSGGSDQQDNWCPDCETHCKIIDKK